MTELKPMNPFQNMKTKSLIAGIFIATTTLLTAATNDLSSLLQKGLFEEEANRNLEAATAAYQTLVTQFDKDRQIGATAIFRLGEVYRKQGRTNEAVAQYERIVRDFAEQATLVMLSRQNLAGLRPPIQPPHLIATAPQLPPPVSSSTDFQTRLMEIIARAGGDTNEFAQRLRTIPERTLRTAPDVDANGGLINEDDEIRRLQTLIQNSPDLINGSAENESPLFEVARRGQLRVAKFLLDNNVNVNKVAGGQLALHQAVQYGRKAMVELLLQRGADVNAKDGTGGTALHSAAQNGFLSIAEVLLKYKADLNARNSRQNGEHSPLHLAARNGHAALVGFLLANGDDANRKNSSGETPLHLVAAQGRDGVIERLLKSGADVNAADNEGETPLMNAADQGHSVSVKALLAAKANPDLLSKQGRTALSYAIGRGHTEVVKMLLDAKADVNAGTADSPLLLAVRADNLALAETLLRLDANPNQETEVDEINTSRLPAGIQRSRTGSRRKITPLRASVWEEYPAMTKLLLQFKGDPQAKAYDGSPLLLATLGNAVALKAFLEAGADANGKDGKGQCALIKAASSGNSAAVELLLAHGADVNARGEFDMTPLHWAAMNGVVKPVELLLASKADLQAKSRGGDTPLHLAVGNGWKQIVEMLLTHGADPNVRNNGGATPLDKTKTLTGPTSYTQPIGAESWTKPSELAALLRQHGALDDLPDFYSIRITRQGLAQPQTVFSKGPKLTNQFMLLETVMNFYNPQRHLFIGGVQRTPSEALSFPDFGRIIIHRPSQKPGGKDQEIKVSLLYNSNVLDCARDVPVQFGDVIEIPERVHALNEVFTDPVREMERVFMEANRADLPERQLRGVPGMETNATIMAIRAAEADRKAATKRWACLQKSLQLVVAGAVTPLTVDSWKEGFLGQALTKMEARAALRSSSDLSRVQVKRKDPKSGKAVVLTVNVSEDPQRNDDLWLRDGDVIEVPDKP